MDTKWLQRDFNIHIINLFDTHKASRVLGMPKFSYAFLLSHYFSVSTNKIYQRADWRERPLSVEMLKYARMDTHYLLPIYDSLRIDIQKQSKTMNLS
jgi:exosome complex exonuclease RRP6